MEIWEEACRVEEELRDEIEESSWEEESVSRVGARVVAMEPLEVMVDCDHSGRNWRKGRKGTALKSWNGVRDLANVKVTDSMLRTSAQREKTADWRNDEHRGIEDVELYADDRGVEVQANENCARCCY